MKTPMNMNFSRVEGSWETRKFDFLNGSAVPILLYFTPDFEYLTNGEKSREYYVSLGWRNFTYLGFSDWLSSTVK